MACVATVSARVRREKLGREQKNKECSRSNFHAITRLETLATQARFSVLNRINKIGQILKKIHHTKML